MKTTKLYVEIERIDWNGVIAGFLIFVVLSVPILGAVLSLCLMNKIDRDSGYPDFWKKRVRYEVRK